MQFKYEIILKTNCMQPFRHMQILSGEKMYYKLVYNI